MSFFILISVCDLNALDFCQIMATFLFLQFLFLVDKI